MALWLKVLFPTVDQGSIPSNYMTDDSRSSVIPAQGNLTSSLSSVGTRNSCGTQIYM